MTRPALLALSLAALAVGPILGDAAGNLRSRNGQLVLIALVFLVVVQVLPEAWEALGPASLLVFVAGWALPSAVERWQHSEELHAIPRGLVAVGLAGHAVLDGAALGAPTEHALGLAVILHRIPAAAATWMVLAPAWGRGSALAVLGLTGFSTVIGYGAASSLDALHEAGPVAIISALVAGSLLHLATHKVHHDHDHDHDHDHPDKT